MKGEGKRLFYMAVSTLMAIGFIAWQPEGQLGAAGYTILIGIAMLCYNKARGETPEKKPDPPSGSPAINR